MERGQAWDEIAILNSLEEPFFKVTPRSVRDQYSLLVKKYKSKWRAEDKASRTALSHTEIDEALLYLIEWFDEADTARQKATAEKKSKVKEELVQAQSMRNVSLETFGKTRKRNENDTGKGSQKRSRRSRSNDSISYFVRSMKGKFNYAKKNWILKKQDLVLQAQQI